MTTRHSRIDTELGELTLVADGGEFTGLYFPHHWHMPPRLGFGPAVVADADPLFASVREQLSAYLTGERTAFDVPARTQGHAFEERVWKLLKEIPHGTTTTYGALARQLGDGTLAQDVGRAVGQNPLCVIVPCHRVIGANGKLTGYAGGLARKRLLLEREQAISPELPEVSPAPTLF
jgi:methylated-DNA-[protein]-cysteine S-methyltransferase